MKWFTALERRILELAQSARNLCRLGDGCLSLVTLSIATSLDALAVGLSMAFIGVSVWLPSVLIGLVACGLSAVGIAFGSRIGPRWGPWAERLGGCVLILIGVKILVSHLAA
jgi:manganese efflux pump family protein